MNFMLSCQSASRLVSQSLDRPLHWQEKLALRFHLAICRHCRRFVKQLNQLQSAVKTMMQRTEADASIMLKPEAKARIMHIIQQHH